MTIRKKPFQKLLYALLLLLFIPAAAGCSDRSSNDVRIELKALDGKELQDSEAVFPRFVSGSDAAMKELNKLNKEVDRIREDYLKRTEKGKEFFVHTYVRSVDAVPQCTITWYEEHSLLGDDYNLMTLAYVKETGEIMTTKDALNCLQIDGIALSTNVGKLYNKMYGQGTLTETEMQGFETDEKGTVTGIYMKLTIETEDTENDDETAVIKRFYYYDLKDDLRPLQEHGITAP